MRNMCDATRCYATRRYKTEGESNVYTIGVIGGHRVVTTKLPMVGRERAAKISSANQTTRLCGIFQDIEHVILLGIAGGIPHFTNFLKHSRRGDIVVSAPNADDHIYIYCDNVRQSHTLRRNVYCKQ